MDSNITAFIKNFSFTLLILTAIVSLFALIYIYSIGIIHTIVIPVLLVISLAMVIAFIAFSFVLVHIYKRGHADSVFYSLACAAIKTVMPFIITVSNVMNKRKDDINRLYITLNNILVCSKGLRFKASDILIVLPHCLQNFDCDHKITNNINNCRGCGRCCIANICDVAKRFGVNAAVVTGGTAARNIAQKLRPRLILAVACERDLVSGIFDTASIPVMGITNSRPNGPCYNTCVEVEVIEDNLKRFISV